jgi:hypothetical protein
LLLSASAFADTLIEDFGTAGISINKIEAATPKAMSQRFTIDGGECFDTVNWYINIDAGNPSGTVYLRVETTTGNNPSGTLVHADSWSSTVTPNGWVNFTLGQRLCDGVELAAGTMYHVLVNVTHSTSDAANYWRGKGNNGDYARGTPYTCHLDSGGGWVNCTTNYYWGAQL